MTDLSETHGTDPQPAAATSVIDTEQVLQSAIGRSLGELRSMRYTLGAALHADFLTLKNQELIGGVALADAVCPGMVGDVLASCDGSSKYLQLSFNLNNAAAQASAGLAGSFEDGDFSGRQRDYISNFAKSHGLQADVLLTANGWVSGESAGTFHVTAGERSRTVTVQSQTNHDSPGNRQRLQECAALACLTEASMAVATLGADHSITVVKRLFAGDMEIYRGTELNSYTQLAESVRLQCEGKWRDIYDVLETQQGPIVACGESFTFGKLGRLFSSLSGSSEQVAFSYGWYHKNAKHAMGVDPVQTSDENIAEPETVVQGALGLLHNGPGTPGIAVATSGWANNTWLADSVTGEKNDFFSVAAATRSADGYPICSCRISLRSTADSGASPERRLLTRELGVLAGLLTFSKVLLLENEGARKAVGETAEFIEFQLTQIVDSLEGELRISSEVR